MPFRSDEQDGTLPDLDDRTLKGVGKLYHQSYHIVVRRFDSYAGFLDRRIALSKCIKRTQARLGDQFAEIILGKRLAKVIDLVVIYAVFTKQRRKIAAGRSGRFFVNSYFHRKDYITSERPKFGSIPFRPFVG